MTENSLFLLPALRRARDLIDRDYAEPLDLDAMAGEAGYSRFHFARAFRAAYGETPRTYLTRRRIERAKTLLRTANLSVTEICFLVGFASLGSFSARFHKLVGRSPSEYRDDAVARTGVPTNPGVRGVDVDSAAPGQTAIRKKHRTPRPGYGAPKSAEGGAPMISRLNHVNVFVLDQDRAKVFYTETLGFELRNDATLDGFRWLTVGLKDQTDLNILLAYPAPPMFSPEDAEAVRALVAKGSLGGGVFETADCQKTFEELSAKGVTFLQEPAERPYGIEALFRDDSGNWFSLTQPKWLG
jgi:AraC-like DNA-binding protein/catechol 2,3-dioxygenase-like lactoylglutathione lyase family enzyme